jgi:hypothetical protein
MRISVDKKTIATSCRRNSGHCMIADSMKRLGGKYVLVDLQTIRYSDLKKGTRYTFLTPPTAQRALLAFDQGKAVKPFAFELGAPVKTRKVMRAWTGDPKVLKRARATYERVNRKRGSRRNVASRERRFGVRLLAA